MTTQTLRNGDGKDLSIKPGESIQIVAVTGSYTASIIAGVGTPSVIATDATGGNYGPYATGAVIRFRSSPLSEIDFEIGTAPAVVSDTPVMASKTLTGGVELSAGETDIPVTSPVTFAQLMIAVAAGFVGLAFVTDVGGGSIWVSDGTRARPLNGEAVLYKNGAAVNFAMTTPRTIGIEVPLPIGIWKDNDVLEVTVDLYKSGTADASATQISIGSPGVVGSQLGNAVLQMASGGNRRAFGTFRFKRNSATSVTLLNGPNGQDGIAASSDLATTTNPTILNMDALQHALQITNAMTTGGSDVVSVNLALVKVISA